ncbi:hypothetical protein FXO38_30162 [Capsicum annuum]|nr:hypothetical protein FXO38_30162 [Capsicum annuum]KAF3679778.1 hypothetical protein FXO37_03678 [Capsicum annuum]
METNTFSFLWEETTITLEDMVVKTNYSVKVEKTLCEAHKAKSPEPTNSKSREESNWTLQAPLHWAWERFTNLHPKPNIMYFGEPKNWDINKFYKGRNENVVVGQKMRSEKCDKVRKDDNISDREVRVIESPYYDDNILTAESSHRRKLMKKEITVTSSQSQLSLVSNDRTAKERESLVLKEKKLQKKNENIKGMKNKKQNL